MATTIAYAQSNLDQFIQAADTAISVEFEQGQVTQGGIVFEFTSGSPFGETRIVFNETGTYLITADALISRLDATTDMNFFMWYEIDTGGGFAKVSNVTMHEILGSLDDDEVHPASLPALKLSVSSAGDKLRIRMQADLLRNSGILEVSLTDQPSMATPAPAITVAAIKTSSTP